MKNRLLSVLGLLLAAVLLVGCAGGAAEPTTEPAEEQAAPEDAGTESTGGNAAFKVAAVMGLGGLGDGSLSDAIYSGLVRAESDFGVEIQVIEPTEIAEFESHFAELSRSGEYDLLVGAGFDQGEAITTVAAEFPDQKFLLVDGGIDNDTNVTSISYANNERSFIVGILAGMMTETGQVGVIGGVDAPFVHNCVAGYMAGAQYANPEAQVAVKYTDSWTDTSLAKEISIAMFDSGVDIIYNQCGGAGLGIYTAAEEKGFYAIGTETNQNGLAPDNIVCSALSLMGDTVYRGIQDAMEGNLVPGPEMRGFAAQGIGYTTEDSNVQTPAEVTDFMDAAIEKIISGEIVVPEQLEDVEPFLEANKK